MMLSMLHNFNSFDSFLLNVKTVIKTSHLQTALQRMKLTFINKVTMHEVAFAAASGEAAGFGAFGPPVQSLSAQSQLAPVQAPLAPPTPIVKTRSKFPETWIWNEAKNFVDFSTLILKQ